MKTFTLIAKHPQYAISTYSCTADFTNCPPPGSGTDYSFTPAQVKLWDDGVWVAIAYRQASWWQQHGFTASRPGGPSLTDAHYIALSKKITGENSWPQFFILYQDGNGRLIPHPPTGASSVCFGSSFLIGPTVAGTRPIAAISAMSFDSTDKSLTVTYANGGSARLTFVVDRAEARVQVQVNYPTNTLPWGGLRSMYAGQDSKSDAAKSTLLLPGGASQDMSIMGSFDGEVTWARFYRAVPSQHNQSAPDFTVLMDDDGDGVTSDLDGCPLDSTKLSPGICGCGVVDADTDKDGVADCKDLCPNTIPGASVDAVGCPPLLASDSDRDGDVDVTDLTRFVACATGPDVSYDTALLPAGCVFPLNGQGRLVIDFDQDKDVDQIDFGIFQRCFSGSHPFNPACAN